MHSYSIDTDARKTVHVLLVLGAIALSGLTFSLASRFQIPQAWVASATTGACFGALYLAFDRWAWRVLTPLHGVPNLNGIWAVRGQSSFRHEGATEPAGFEGEMRIRQSFSRIHLCADFEQSTSKSTMASIQIEGAVTSLGYAFENAPKNLADDSLQRHPGLATAILKDQDTLEVEYFSGKHRLRYGTMTLKRKR
jgi:hypothetical protein